MTDPNVKVLATVTGVDLTVVAETNLISVLTDVVITGVIVRITAATSVTVNGAASVGKTATAYNDIWLDQILMGLTAVNDVFSYVMVGKTVTVDLGQLIKFKVNTGAVATVLTASVDIYGYEI